MGFIDWIGGKVEALVAPFKMVGDVVGGVMSKAGGFFRDIAGGGKESGAALNDAFATGIQSNAAAPEGPLSEITSSGRALTETFASGMDENDLREKASVVFSAAMPQGDGGIDFSVPERQGGQGTQTVHIQNLYLQADDCQNLLDFVRMIMHSVNRPQEAMV